MFVKVIEKHATLFCMFCRKKIEISKTENVRISLSRIILNFKE